MDLFDRLSDEDKKTFRSYIKTYDDNFDYDGEEKYAHSFNYDANTADLSYLLRFWNRNKHNLAPLFNEDLRFSIPVKIEKPYRARDLASLNDSLLCRELCRYACTVQDEPTRAALYNFLSLSEYIYNNIYSGPDFTLVREEIHPYLDPPEPRSITIKSGIKYSRAMKKIATFLGYAADYSAWNLEQSRLLNDKMISGDLIFSIHPMDFITMSDGTFSSCMSWTSGKGCYRAGTVEMMNSPFAIVVYFNSKDKIRWEDNFKTFSYPAKKWRTLVLIDPRSFICSVKAYPYEHKELTQIILETLKNRCQDIYNTEFIDNIYTNTRPMPLGGTNHICTIEDINLSPNTEKSDNKNFIRFNTDDANMFCDFGAAAHWCYISCDFYENYNYLSYEEDDNITVYDINYAGEMECMNCGGLMDYVSEDESKVLCWDCSFDVIITYCEDCGKELLLEDAFIGPNFECLCEDCLNLRRQKSELFVAARDHFSSPSTPLN